MRFSCGVFVQLLLGYFHYCIADREDANVYSVTFIVEDNTPANHLIGNIPKQTKDFPSMNPNSPVNMRPFSTNYHTEIIDENYPSTDQLISVTTEGDLCTLVSIDRDDSRTLCSPLECCELLSCQLNFNVSMTNMNEGNGNILVMVSIVIQDSNDNAPVFPQEYFILEMDENFGEFRVIDDDWDNRLPMAHDNDSATNGIIDYEIISKNPLVNEIFSIDKSNFSSIRLSLNPHVILDYENDSMRNFRFNISAIDGGHPAKTDSIMVQIRLRDLDDNKPVFKNDNYAVTVDENKFIDSPLFTFYASDMDSGIRGDVVYSIDESFDSLLRQSFKLDKINGQLFLNKPLDFEMIPNYGEIKLPIIARSPLTNSLSNSVVLSISVRDINDNEPVLKYINPIYFTENQPENSLITTIGIEDMDVSSNGKIYCELLEYDPQIPIYIKHNKEVSSLQLFSAKQFDYDEQSSYIVPLLCNDTASPLKVSYFNLTVHITDQNDNAPILFFPQNNDSFKFKLSEDFDHAKAIYKFFASDKDKNSNGKITFSLEGNDSEQFHIDPATGNLFAKRAFDYELKKSYKFTVIAMDNPDRGLPLTAKGKVNVEIIDVNDNSPILIFPENVISISEEEEPGLWSLQLKFYDPDPVDNNEILVSFNNDVNLNLYETARSHFELSQNGKLSLIKRIDHEEISKLTLPLKMVDSGNPIAMTATCDIPVYVDDVNDNMPELIFPKNKSVIQYQPIIPNKDDDKLLAEKNITLTVAKLDIYDKDTEFSKDFTFQIGSTCNGSKLFTIISHDPKIMLKPNNDQNSSVIDVNYPKKGFYEFCFNVSEEDDKLDTTDNNYTLFINVHEPKTLASARAMWPSDSALSYQNGNTPFVFQRLKNDSMKDHSSWRVNYAGSTKRTVSNIVILTLVVIFSGAFVCIVIAVAFWVRERRISCRKNQILMQSVRVDPIQASASQGAQMELLKPASKTVTTESDNESFQAYSSGLTFSGLPAHSMGGIGSFTQLSETNSEKLAIPAVARFSTHSDNQNGIFIDDRDGAHSKLLGSCTPGQTIPIQVMNEPTYHTLQYINPPISSQDAPVEQYITFMADPGSSGNQLPAQLTSLLQTPTTLSYQPIILLPEQTMDSLQRLQASTATPSTDSGQTAPQSNYSASPPAI